MNLEQSRKTIDEIDSQLTKLFAERMSCAAEIAAYKKENNLPVLDAGRERQKLAAISELVPDELENSARCLYSLIFSLSRAYQHRAARQRRGASQKNRRCHRADPQSLPAQSDGRLPGCGGRILSDCLRKTLPGAEHSVFLEL